MIGSSITATELSKIIASALADERMKRHREELSAPHPEEEKDIARRSAAQYLRIHQGQNMWGFDYDDSLDDALIEEAIAHVLGLGKLQPLLEDPEISDIHVRGNCPVWVKMRSGERIQHAPIVQSDAELIELVRRIATRMGHREQRFDPAHPELNLQMPDGSRLFATMEISSRPSMVIRRHRFDYSSLGELVSQKMMTPTTAQFLAASVRARYNIVITGGTGTGKTTLLRALINEIPRAERIVTIEDAFEIGIEHFETAHPDHDSLQARPANTEGLGEVKMADLVRMALRMDPDRVIVGEVRGAEAFSMLLAMTQGNNGSMCTIHADRARTVFPKLLAYVSLAELSLPPEAVYSLISTAVHLVVHIQIVEGVRQIVSIHEVVDTDGQSIASNEIFSQNSQHPDFVGIRSETAAQLELHGFSRPREMSWQL
jgi:Flp pilus assembly CpaF family ATPase